MSPSAISSDLINAKTRTTLADSLKAQCLYKQSFLPLNGFSRLITERFQFSLPPIQLQIRSRRRVPFWSWRVWSKMSIHYWDKFNSASVNSRVRRRELQSTLTHISCQKTKSFNNFHRYSSSSRALIRTSRGTRWHHPPAKCQIEWKPSLFQSCSPILIH